MMHNPFQSYQTDPTLGAYPGIANPFTLPFTAMQSAAINPALNPLAAIQGLSSCATAGGPQIGQQAYPSVPNFVGLHPQQLAAFQNPWIQTGLQNPLFTAVLQNPFLNPILAQQLMHSVQPYSPYGQQPFGQVSPFAQQGLPYGQGLPSFAQQGLPYGTQGLPFPQQVPYGQLGSPYGQLGSPLAPQTWVGQAGPFGGGQAYGQINPLLAQLGARQFHTPGISPWGF